MENQENNNMSELDQLKAQYETLKQQFDQQEIVNDRLMKSSIKRNVDFYMRYRWRQYILYPVAVLAGLLVIKWEFGNNLSLRLFWMAYCLVSFAVELWMLRKLRVKTMENNDLLTLSNQARSFKKLFTVFTILSVVPILILVVGMLLSKVGNNIHLPSFDSFLLAFCATLVLFVCIGIAEIRHKTKPCDEIIQQIEPSETPTDRKKGFDRRQMWFCVAMIVAFLCLDVWAYMIEASHLKLPPMWRQVTYTRTDDNLPMDDGLSIWEVFADTVVPEKNVPELRQILNNDSYVIMKEQQQKASIEVSDEAIHSWRQDENNPEAVKLYLLKKDSEEGPIVSSSCIGGKPVVEKVVVQKPYFDNESEIIPMVVYLTPEARQHWSDYVKTMSGNDKTISGKGIKSIDIALVVDGVVYQKINFTSIQNVTPNAFYIMREWSSKEELEAFCKRLIKQ